MADSTAHGNTGIFGRVTHSDGAGYVSDAEVELYRLETSGSPEHAPPRTTRTDAQGRFQLKLDAPGTFLLKASAFGLTAERRAVDVETGCAKEVVLPLELTLRLLAHEHASDDTLLLTQRAIAGRRLSLRLETSGKGVAERSTVRWLLPSGVNAVEIPPDQADLVFSRSGKAHVAAALVEREQSGGGRAEARTGLDLYVTEPEAQTIRGNVGITLQRSASEPTLDQALWVAIRERTEAISFGRYRAFINRVLRWEEGQKLPGGLEHRLVDLSTHLHGMGAYKVLKAATEVFLLLECGVRIGTAADGRPQLDLLEEQARLGEPLSAEAIAARLREYLGSPAQLPYINRIVDAAFPELERITTGENRLLFAPHVDQPCLIELIWSYWHEEGMLMQTINAISQRFQNVRGFSDRNPLLNMELDPLRPLNNLLWGFVQDETDRLTVARRDLEYRHEYGLAIYGKATRALPPVAESRSKFLEAFHNLLHQTSIFYKQDFQTTVIADGFPLLNALKEVHLVLAQGAGNQSRDLPWTARKEMLIVQYLLARSETRDFLQSRAMVPYKEPWMPQVDAMKSLQGWSDVTVTHFRDLATFGEQLLLSIRYGDWIDVNDENSAKNWARYWRPEVQGYMHAYRAVTGVDLGNADSIDSTVPGVFLRKRLAMQLRSR
jgi:hypothetical protein